MPDPTLPNHDSFAIVAIPMGAEYVVIQKDNHTGQPNLVFAKDAGEIRSIFTAFDFGYELGRQS